MRLFPRKKREFTILAVSDASILSGIDDKDLLKREVQRRLDDFLPGTLLASSVNAQLDKTVIIYPDEWESPTDFSDPASFLNGQTWNRICEHLAKNKGYGKLKYNHKKNKTVHFVTPDREVAVFQFSAR
ncbi:hypothetical protein LJC56_01330 [Christensenellaceae bacterium OttesenSCG-928-K19]|nr:hypothetical protein [Christensenellaceae bacterium OttesenSCG-928-K19]